MKIVHRSDLRMAALGGTTIFEAGRRGKDDVKDAKEEGVIARVESRQ